MRKIFLVIVFLFCINSIKVNATTYYLSSTTGNDNYSGIFPDSAWKTLDRLNIINLFPGDSILLKCGEAFFGTIKIHNSGGINSPIYFGKYGTGALPIISGFKKLTGWTNTGNIYSVIDTNDIKSIWCNGKWMQIARYPNSGFISNFHPNANNLLFNNLLSNPNGYWDNASVAIRSSGIRYEMSRIDTYYQGNIVLANPTQYNIPQFYGFFFYNKLSELDTANEWFCDTLSNQVFIIPPNGISLINADVQASEIDYGFYSSTDLSNIIIDNIEFSGQSKDAIHLQGLGVGIVIENCSFKKCKERAINFQQTTTYSRLIGNEIEDCGGEGIFSLFFFHCRIGNNHIRRIGLERGFGFENYCQGIGIHLSSGILDTVIHNSIDSCGYGGIRCYNSYNRFEENIINHSMLLLDGGGGMMFFGLNSSLVTNNFILNTIGNIEGTTSTEKSSYGIYFAENIQNDSIINNTIVNSDSYGIYIGPYNQNHFLKGNVLYNNQDGQLFIADGDPINSTNNIQLHQNILYSLNEKQKSIQLTGMNSNFLPVKADSNYYCNPYDYFPIYQKSVSDTVVSEKIFSLPSWQKATLQDSNSHVSNVEWQNYYVTDTTGSDLITNGNFTNNYDGWNTEPSANNSLLLDNLTMMDDGCIKFEVTDTIPYDYAKTVSNDFALQINQFYQMSFSTAGFKNGILHSDITEQISPYDGIGVNKYFPIETFRKDFNYFFQTSTYGNPLGLNFELHKSDSLVYFDNIHLFPVSVFKHDSSRMSVLLMNYSPNTISVPLGTDSVFRDLDGNMLTGSYTLNPFSSYVLVLDSPLNLVSIKEIPKQNSIIVFPNPVQSSNGKISIQLPDENKYDFEVYDLTGRKFQFGKFSGSTINTFSMKNASAGMYILSVHSAIKLWQQKIVVVN